MNKSLIGLIGAAVLTSIGVYLRLNAHAMAWTGVSSWSGPDLQTPYGRQEIAIGQVGIALMLVGILLLIVTYVHWLFAKGTDK
jgi:hypothetical protein